jgi:ATP-dependent exoDNAse (exonuclease V) alpha subunit
VEITDERTGEIHDYQRKAGVQSAELFLPADAPEWATDRAKLWNAAEQSEKRKNSTVAREFEVTLPSELSADQRRELTREFARELVKRHGFAVDVAIHAPGKDGDSKNHHAHILCTTRKLTPEGFTEKTRELDDRATGAAEVTHWREQWAGLTNAALERAGHAERVDHRTLEAQGIDREAGVHLGPTATAIERRGEVSEKTQHHQERQAATAAKVADLAQQLHQVEGSISQLTHGLAVGAQMVAAAEAEIARQKPAGIDPRSRYHPDNIAKREAQEAQEAATAAKKPAPRVAPKIEPKAVERVRPVAPQPKPTPQQEARAQKAQKLAELAALPLGDQGKVFDYTLTKFTQIRQEKLNRVSAKVLKRQERRGKALQAVFNSRPPEPTGMLATFKRGAYERAMDALEPIYQKARKLAKQAEALTQKVAAAAKQAHSWAYSKLQKSDPGLVQRVETHRYDERMEASRRQRVEREAQKAIKGPDKGISR